MVVLMVEFVLTPLGSQYFMVAFVKVILMQNQVVLIVFLGTTKLLEQTLGIMTNVWNALVGKIIHVQEMEYVHPTELVNV